MAGGTFTADGEGLLDRRGERRAGDYSHWGAHDPGGGDWKNWKRLAAGGRRFFALGDGLKWGFIRLPEQKSRCCRTGFSSFSRRDGDSNPGGVAPNTLSRRAP